MWSSGHTAYMLTASVIMAVQLANLAISVSPRDVRPDDLPR